MYIIFSHTFIGAESKTSMLLYDVANNNHTAYDIKHYYVELGLFVRLRGKIVYVLGYDHYFGIFYPLHQLLKNGSFVPLEMIPFSTVWADITTQNDNYIEATRLKPLLYHTRHLAEIEEDLY